MKLQKKNRLEVKREEGLLPDVWGLVLVVLLGFFLPQECSFHRSSKFQVMSPLNQVNHTPA